MGDNVTVSCPDSATCHVLGQVTSYFLIGPGDTCYMGFWRNQSWILIVESHFMVNFVHFSPRCVHVKTISLPTCSRWESICAKEQLFLYYEYNQKNLDEWADPLQRKQETHRAQCGFAPGTKADTILEKSPSPFPCPLLTIILLSVLSPPWPVLTITLLCIFDPCPGAWPQAPETPGICCLS